MEKKELLIDCIPVKFTITESKDGSGKLIARGEYARSDVPTANKRIYQRALFERELGRLDNDIQARKVFGELDHPGDGKTKLSRVSHLVTGISIDAGGVVVGESEVLNTEQGKNLKAIVEAGGTVGVSSRGYGSTKKDENGYDVVQEDYTLLTFDFVADPANGASYPKFFNEDQKVEKKGKELVVENKMKTKIKLEEVMQDDELVAFVKEKLEPGVRQDVAKLHQEEMDNLRDRFTRELLTKISSMRDEVRQEEVQKIKSELMSDPAIGGAKTALESIKQLLRPYILPEDTEKELSNRDSKIKELSTQMESRDKDMSALKTKLEEMAKVTKELGYKLQLERRTAAHAKKDKVIEMIGDVSAFASLDELNTKIDTVVKLVDEEQKQVEQKTEEKTNEANQFRKELDEAKKQVEVLKKTAVQHGLRAILEQKIALNPNAPKIRKLFEEKSVTTLQDLNALVEQFSVARKTGSDYDKIRSRFDKYKGKKDLVEDQIRDAGGSKQTDTGALLESELGGDVSEILKLSGVQH